MSWIDDPTMAYQEPGQRGGASLATLAKLAQMSSKASSMVDNASAMASKGATLAQGVEGLKGAMQGVPGAMQGMDGLQGAFDKAMGAEGTPEESVRTIAKNVSLKNAGAQARVFMQYVLEDPAMRLYCTCFLIVTLSLSGFAYMHYNPSENEKRVKRALWYNVCAGFIVLLLSFTIASDGEVLDMFAHALMVYVIVRAVSAGVRTAMYGDQEGTTKAEAAASMATHAFVIAGMGAFLVYDLIFPIGGVLMAFFRARTKRVAYITLLFLIICGSISGGMSALVVHPEYSKLTLSSDMNLAAESVASLSVLEMATLLVTLIAFSQYKSSAAGAAGEGSSGLPSLPGMPSMPGLPGMPSMPKGLLGRSKKRGSKKR